MTSTGAETEGGDGVLELRRLVEGTRGVQPWRRLFHATNGLLLVAAALRWPHSGGAFIGGLAVLLALLALVDWIRLRSGPLNVFFFRVFRSLASPREAVGLASSTWYVAGVGLALVLFGRPAALAGVLVLALADPAASVVGRLWGRASLGTGTVEGTLVFAVVAFVAAAAFVPLPAAAAAACAASLVEPLPWSLDDNLTIPVAAAAGAWIVGAM